MAKLLRAVMTSLSIRRKDDIYRWYYYRSM